MLLTAHTFPLRLIVLHLMGLTDAMAAFRAQTARSWYPGGVDRVSDEGPGSGCLTCGFLGGEEENGGYGGGDPFSLQIVAGSAILDIGRQIQNQSPRPWDISFQKGQLSTVLGSRPEHSQVLDISMTEFEQYFGRHGESDLLVGR